MTTKKGFIDEEKKIVITDRARSEKTQKYLIGIESVKNAYNRVRIKCDGVGKKILRLKQWKHL